MKTIKAYFGAISFALLVNGCADLNTYPEGKTVTEDQKDKVVDLDPSKVEAGINGVFAIINTFAIGTGDESQQDDIGYPAIMLYMDTSGSDMVSADLGYNWHNDPLTYSDRLSTSTPTLIIWNTLYKQIFAANDVVSLLGKEPTDSSGQYYLAQALAVRAFDYWVLAQLYQFTYMGHQSSPCVPLVTEANSQNVWVGGVPRSTVEDVYAQIMKDINRAIELLEKTSMTKSGKRYVSKAAAYGLRARFNLTMQKWAEAAADAQKAIDGSGEPYSRAEVNHPTFTDAHDHAWIWAIDVAETDRVVTTAICNFPSHMGSFSFGYAPLAGGKRINKVLFNSIPSTDVRKGWWLNESKQSPNLNDEQKEYVKEHGLGAYVQVKYGPYKDVLNTNVNASDIPLMRVEEMYLIKAEGLAMSGSTVIARSALEDFVRTYRDPSYTCSATTAEDMQNEIYHQRRIEFWGEGLNWFDVMRLKKGVDRRGGAYPNPTSIFELPSESPIFLYLIPEDEIQSNPQINPDDNNPPIPRPLPVPDF